MGQDLERLQERRQAREHREKEKSQPTIAPIRRRLDKVSKHPGPMQFSMSMTPVLPYLYTYDKKMTHYSADPSAFLHIYIKPTKSQKPDQLEYWFGFRLAPIAGSGIYNHVAGRFGFTYFGPMFGLGKIGSAVSSLGVDERLPEQQRTKDFDRDAFFWMSGLAFQSRNGSVEKGRNAPEDFDGTSFTIDVPGLWTELTYANVYYNKISTQYQMGLQLGKGKIFIYLGLGAGFWY